MSTPVTPSVARRVPTLGANGRFPDEYTPQGALDAVTASEAAQGKAEEAQQAAEEKAQELADAKGSANGVASLDGGAKVPESQLPTRLSAQELSGTFAALDGVTRTPRVAGDGLVAALDWRHEGANYLTHFTAKAGSSGALAAYGTDDGAADGILISHKSGASVGQRINQQPGAGFGRYATAYSTNAIDWTDIYKGSPGHVDRLRVGQGFADGVLTSGSTKLTSASAAFTAADVGRTVSQLTSTGASNPLGAIPAGASIVSVQSATEATLSAPATAAAVTLRFRIDGRPIAWDQRIYTAYDTDGTTVLGLINQAGIDWRAGQVDRPAAKFRGKSGQTGTIVEVLLDGNATPALQVAASGRVGGAFTASWNNAGAQTANVLQAINYSAVAGVSTLFVKGASGQVGDQIHIEDSAGVVQSRFDAAGRLGTRVATAPSDASMAAGEAFLYVDATAGAPKLKIKIKDAAGAVVTKEL